MSPKEGMQFKKKLLNEGTLFWSNYRLILEKKYKISAAKMLVSLQRGERKNSIVIFLKSNKFLRKQRKENPTR